MKPLITALVAALALGVAAPASAQQRWQGTDDFSIDEGEGGCFVTAEYEAPGRQDTQFSISQNGEEVRIAFYSGAWSKPAEDERLSYDFLPNVGTWSGPAIPLTIQSIYNGFVTVFSTDVLRDFAAASSLRVRRGDVVIEHINLGGSAATTATMRRCTASVQAREAAEARERARLDYIAKDPFAKP